MAGIMGAMSSMLPVANGGRGLYNYLYRLFDFASHKDLVKMYTAATSDLFVGHEHTFKFPPALTAFRSMLMEVKSLRISGLQKLLLADFNAILFGVLLPKMNIAIS